MEALILLLEVVSICRRRIIRALVLKRSLSEYLYVCYFVSRFLYRRTPDVPSLPFCVHSKVAFLILLVFLPLLSF